MNIKYKLKESGYLVIMRDFQKLLQIENINFTLLGTYLCFLLQADWDSRHSHYRAILPNDTDLANLWNCNTSTICRSRKKLISVGLLEQISGITYIKNFNMFQIGTVKALIKKRLTDSQLLYAKSEDELAESLYNIE